MLAVIIGLLLGLLICFIWWVWASTSYRFSDSRIRMLLSDLYLKYLGQTLEPTQVSKVISYQVFPQVVTMVDSDFLGTKFSNDALLLSR
jgi:hypothetical protein